MSDRVKILDHEEDIIEGTGKYSHWEIDNKLDRILNYTFRDYVSLPGGRETTSTSPVAFQDEGISCYFNFDKSKYPNVQAIYFACNMRISNGAGKASTILYDFTNSVEMVDMETSSSGDGTVITSSDIKANIPNTKTKYVIYADTNNASYTAYCRAAFLIIDYKLA